MAQLLEMSDLLSDRLLAFYNDRSDEEDSPGVCTEREIDEILKLHRSKWWKKQQESQ